MTCRLPALAGLLVFLVLSPSRAAARDEAPDEDPLLVSLVREGLARNPDILAAEEAAAAARERPAQVRALPDPQISLNYTNDGWSPTLGERDMTNLSFMASQMLPVAGKRRLRGQIADREAAAAVLVAERVRLGVAAATRRAYWGLVLARDLLALVGEQEEVWRQTEGVARARYAVGQGAQPDVLRAQVERTRVELVRAEQSAEITIRVAELNRLVGRPGDAALPTTAHLGLHPDERSLDERLREAEARSPELQAAALDIERNRLALDLARREVWPDLTVQAGYMNRGGLEPMWQAGVAIALPLHRKRIESGVAEAEARRRESERHLEAVRLDLRYRTEVRDAQLRTAETLAHLYDGGIIPQAQMSVEATIANYQAGKVAFIAVLEALATLYGERANQLRVLAGHERTRASLDEASLEAGSSDAGKAMGGTGR
jgi:outer membrane protein, heavy metal efflux system